MTVSTVLKQGQVFGQISQNIPIETTIICGEDTHLARLTYADFMKFLCNLKYISNLNRGVSEYLGQIKYKFYPKFVIF